jgi:ABC-2 type transport system ATP-binding protein
MSNIIEVSNLSKGFKIYKKKAGLKGSLENLISREYEQLEAIKEISFNISKGEFVGLIGPNGAGKTTTLKCLSGLIKPTSGEISVLGFNPIDRKKE